MAEEKLYTQADMDGRVKKELEIAKNEYTTLAFAFQDDIRDLKDQCKQKDRTIESLSTAIANLSKGGKYNGSNI